MRITRSAGAAISALTLVIAGCGSQGPVDDKSPAENMEGEVVDQPDDAPNQDGAGEADPDEFSSPLVCDETFLGPATDLDSYTEIYSETNYELEKLVTALGEDFDAYDAGENSVDDFIASLEEDANAYTTITGDALGAGPPTEAQDWHEMTVDSWNRVCQAITDAHEGLVNENEDQFAKFSAALTEFPNLLNDLHANTMVGPGETA